MRLPYPLTLPPLSARDKPRPPKRFRRSIERQPAVHINGLFVTIACMFQPAEGGAVLLLDNVIGYAKERVPAVSLGL